MDFLSLFTLSLYLGSTVLVINYVWKCWKKEASLPEACHYENLTFLIAQSEKKIEHLNSEQEVLEGFVKEKSILEFQIPILKEQLTEKEKELATVSDANMHANKMLRDLGEKIDDLSIEESALAKKIKSLSSSQNALETILKEKKILDMEVATLQQQLLHFQQQIQQQQNELITISAERKKQELIKGKIEELERDLAILREKYAKEEDERKINEQRLDELNRSLLNFKEISHGLDNKISQQQTTLAGLEDGYIQARDKAKDLHAKIAELITEELTLSKSVSYHNEQLRIAAERDVELKMMMEKRIQELSLLDEALKNRQAQIDSLNNITSIAEESVSKVLTRPYLGSYSKRPAITEAEALKNLEHYLQNEGLHFDQRTLYRFHTSLKVTSHCPLVILSGISGTGKTLLAQSYASACGLHFLPMAVQPRWDSPQDLFGYYDFTKKQFAATELSRSLLQMDPYNRNQWLEANSPPQWIDDNLLMVLIDEMNIARVEHYFSELLSKLELRRNCIFSDNTSRRIAEISLSNCILPATEQEVSLFIDHNVLFVGTLNEDETTLSLSDKILDRANVIHFGKPDSFSQKKKSSKTQQNKNMLSYATWQGWIKNDSSIKKTHRSEIERILNDFNKNMDEIGRPIGHRTYQAIIAYIANYPIEGSESKWKEALADQVEQKLMTRLRGVDLSSHHNSLSEIENLVKALEDEKLIQRYSNAKESSYFEWK